MEEKQATLEDHLNDETVETLVEAGFNSDDKGIREAAYAVTSIQNETVNDYKQLADAARELGEKTSNEKFYKAAWAVDDNTATDVTLNGDMPDISIGDEFDYGGRVEKVISTRKNMGALWVTTENTRGNTAEWDARDLDELPRLN